MHLGRFCAKRIESFHEFSHWEVSHEVVELHHFLIIGSSGSCSTCCRQRYGSYDRPASRGSSRSRSPGGFDHRRMWTTGTG